MGTQTSSEGSTQTDPVDAVSTSTTETQTDPARRPERPIPGREYTPPSIEEIAKKAAVGDSVVMSEIESDEFLEAIQDLIDYVQTRAWPDLEKSVLAVEQTLAEQVDDISYKRLPQRKLEEKLGRKREELAAKEGEIKAKIESIKGGATDDKAKAKAQAEKSKTELEKYKIKIRYDTERLKNEADRLRADIDEIEGQLRDIKMRFSSVPNESVYSVAFSGLASSVETYARSVREKTAQVMRLRKDGPLLKIDRDAFEQVADALGQALTGIEEAFKDVLTYTTGTTDNEKGTIKLFDGSLENDMKNVENASVEIQASRLAVYERIRITRYNAVNSAIRDMETVHREVAKRLTKPISFSSSIHQFDLGLLYALKLSRIGLIFAAAYITSRMFENVYVDRMSSKDPDAPDLKWFAGSFLVICILFDLLVLGFAYFVSKALPTQLDLRIIKDFAVDTLVAHTMSGMTLFPLADVIQDKRYFDYQVTAMRALRLMRQLCFSIEGFHAITPYFYLTGPFYVQHKKAATEDVL